MDNSYKLMERIYFFFCFLIYRSCLLQPTKKIITATTPIIMFATRLCKSISTNSIIGFSLFKGVMIGSASCSWA